MPSPPPPCPPPPPPPTPHPPPAPLQPGEKWGAYLVELNFTYPGTKSRLEEPTLETKVGRITDTMIPSIVTDLKSNDGTERPDIVSGSIVYRNTPSGIQRTPTPIGTEPQTITAIASSDIDGDSIPDLVVGFKENPTTPLKRSGVKVFINPGDGDFSVVTPFQVGGSDQETEAVTTVDVNGDGRPDIIVGNKNQLNKIYINRGGNVFMAGIDIGEEMDDTTSIQVVHVAGDSSVDVIVGNRGSPSKVYTTLSVDEKTISFTSPTDVGAQSGGGRTDDTRTISVIVCLRYHDCFPVELARLGPSAQFDVCETVPTLADPSPALFCMDRRSTSTEMR